MVRDLAPDIVILEIGTNDLTHTPPEIVGSHIDDLVRVSHVAFLCRMLCPFGKEHQF